MPRPNRSKGAASMRNDEFLTIPQVIEEIGVPRATFYRWRQRGRGPKAIKLPNGHVRIRRSALSSWLEGLEESA
jgi:predicted DNA-binding transcriptional regulator AlpA